MPQNIGPASQSRAGTMSAADKAKLDAMPGALFVYQQQAASASWLIVHGLGIFPEVVVIDTAGTRIWGGITYTDENNLTLNFGNAFSGTAYLR